jgi:creatinine amidohydrolase
MIIVPVGSVEQHGKQLPLGSDFIDAVELSLRIAERTRVLVAPVVLAGVSDYHLGFPGTIALSPQTFEAVLFETARSSPPTASAACSSTAATGGTRRPSLPS